MANTKEPSGYLIERISALHRSLMRKFAAEEELQFVHVEILQYLAICNHYSDTTQAISEYLGQTKSSISQSLAHLEDGGFIKRSQDRVDKRKSHLQTTSKGLAVTVRLHETMKTDDTSRFDSALLSVLSMIQKKNGLSGFGICGSCKFNLNPGKNIFVCGLTKEKLTLRDIEKICREHRSA
jgi:DNA-binding MarR family transcriptional regulator